MQIPELLPITFEFIGTVMIGMAVLRVHNKVEREHKIDNKVLSAIHKEQWLTKIGLILIIIGFILQFV